MLARALGVAARWKNLRYFAAGADALVGASFENVKFSAGTDQKVDVSSVSRHCLQGPAYFRNDIRKYIPLDGFVDPPYIDVKPDA